VHAFVNTAAKERTIPAIVMAATAEASRQDVFPSAAQAAAARWAAKTGTRGISPFFTPAAVRPSAGNPQSHWAISPSATPNRGGPDSFGARYYAPSLGRFLTPDWSSSPEPIPYANLQNPQSLNLYSYVLNNPLTDTDPDGHSYLIFDGNTDTITLYTKEGVKVGTWPAYDNVDSRATIGKLVDGTYDFEKWNPVPAQGAAATPQGSIGPYGVFVLDPFLGADSKSHAGVGVHAGRAGVRDARGRSGPEHATLGCVRACGPAMIAIQRLEKADPLQKLTVIHNRRPKVCKEQTPCGDAAPSPESPKGSGGGSPMPLEVAFHFRPDQARATADHVLSGIEVNETTIPQVIARYGEPSSFREISSKEEGETGPPGSGDREYNWVKGGVRMEVVTEFYTSRKTHKVIESAVSSVAVWGRAPAGAIGTTGRGLSLGDMVAKARRIYGSDCNCGEYKHGTGDQNTHGFTYRYYLEFPAGNYEQEALGALIIDADSHGRVVHLQVVGAN
jgi:RHS repeat-associated protein